MCTDLETDDAVCNSPLPSRFMASDEPRLSLGSIINTEPDDNRRGEGDIIWQSKIYCPFTHTHTQMSTSTMAVETIQTSGSSPIIQMLRV